MTDVLFILDELYPIKNAPSVRIENLYAALSPGKAVAIGGTSSPRDPKMNTNGEINSETPPGYITIPRPSERRPLAFAIFLLKLGVQALRAAKLLRPKIIVLSVPKYEMLLFAPLLARLCSRLVIDVRDSLSFLDYGAYLGHFLPRWLASPVGRLIKVIVTGIQRRSLRAASVVTVANQGIASSLSHDFIHLLPNGVDTEKFCPIPKSGTNSPKTSGEQDSCDDNPIRLVYLGNFAEKDTFDIITELGQSSQIPFVIHLIGEGRNRAQVVENFERARVPFVDHGTIPHEKLPTLLGSMDLGFIFRASGVDESIPVALFEFAACGIPSLCNNIGLMAKVVREHNLGFICSSGSELETALQTWLSNPSKEEWAHSLHRKAVQSFSLGSTRSLFRDLIENLLGNLSGNPAPSTPVRSAFSVKTGQTSHREAQ